MNAMRAMQSGMKPHPLAPAVFLDRDGTLSEPYHYPSRPEHLRLYAGLGAPLATLQRAGFRLVVITNQSGVARGYFSEADLARMHAHLRTALAAQGATLDAIYHCPHHPAGVIPELAMRCDCRKPAPGLPLRAARELQLDLARSWFVGDILDDIEAGARAGCRTVLVDQGTEPLPTSAVRTPGYVAHDTTHALAIILGLEGLAPLPDLDYRPDAWSSCESTCESSAEQTGVSAAHRDGVPAGTGASGAGGGHE